MSSSVTSIPSLSATASSTSSRATDSVGLGAEPLLERLGRLAGELEVGGDVDPARLERADEAVDQLARPRLDDEPAGPHVGRVHELVDRGGAEAAVDLLVELLADPALDVGAQLVERRRTPRSRGRARRRAAASTFSRISLSVTVDRAAACRRRARRRRRGSRRRRGRRSPSSISSISRPAPSSTTRSRCAWPSATRSMTATSPSWAGRPSTGTTSATDALELLELLLDRLVGDLDLELRHLELAPVGRLRLRLHGELGGEPPRRVVAARQLVVVLGLLDRLNARLRRRRSRTSRRCATRRPRCRAAPCRSAGRAPAGGTLPLRKPGILTVAARSLVACSTACWTSSAGTSTVSRTRSPSSCSTCVSIRRAIESERVRPCAAVTRAGSVGAVDVETAIRTRRTHKAYGTEPVPREVIEELLELARWAPNHHLTEPWRFRVLGPESFERLVAAGGPNEREKLGRAPTLVVASATQTGDEHQNQRGRARNRLRRLHRPARRARPRPRVVLAHAEAARVRRGPRRDRPARRRGVRRADPPRPPGDRSRRRRSASRRPSTSSSWPNHAGRAGRSRRRCRR